MVRRWEDDWMRSGSNFAPDYVALARLFENDELKALIQFHGTSQRYFYTVTRFERGVWAEVGGQFRSLEEARSAAHTG
jgi:hypothetical protein